MALTTRGREDHRLPADAASASTGLHRQFFENAGGGRPRRHKHLLWTGGDILLGGGGSDTITGGGGTDLIDGDRWLNVQLRAVLNATGRREAGGQPAGTRR